MDKKKSELIGAKVRGFKFKNRSYIGYEPESMDEYIGKIGTIIEIEKETSRSYVCLVEFEDDKERYWYPMTHISKHLVATEPIDLNDLFQQIKKL
jgi:hypothetical protein